MNTVNLGNLSKPVLVCGGAYGNLQALEKLAELQCTLDIADNHVIHTGDAVAYCADTSASVRYIASRRWHAIKGNVEEQIALGGDDCGCGFEQGSACDAASVRWYAHSVATLSADARQWMAALPAKLIFSMGGITAQVVHGSPLRSNRFMFASLPDVEFQHELDQAAVDLVVAGHTGIPFTKAVGHRYWHNSGALGMPANDGTGRVWASVLRPALNGLDITHHAIEYDAATAARLIRAQHLPRGYAEALETGLWPSLDILPETEKAAAGTPLKLAGKTINIARPASVAAE